MNNNIIASITLIAGLSACGTGPKLESNDLISNIISDNPKHRRDAEERIKALGMEGRIVLKHAILNDNNPLIRERAASLLIDALRRYSPDHAIASYVSCRPMSIESGREDLLRLGVMAIPAMEQFARDKCPADRRADLIGLIGEIRYRNRLIGNLINPEESVKAEARSILRAQGKAAICDLEMEIIAPRSKAILAAAIATLAYCYECSEGAARIKAILHQTIIDIDFDNTPISECLQSLTIATGIRFVLHDTVDPGERISCKCSHISAYRGISLAFIPYKYSYGIDGNTVWIAYK